MIFLTRKCILCPMNIETHRARLVFDPNVTVDRSRVPNKIQTGESLKREVTTLLNPFLERLAKQGRISPQVESTVVKEAT